MRLASIFFGLLLSLTAFGQPAPINRRAFALAGLASAPTWSPTNLSGAALFLNYLDLPLSGKPNYWTSELYSVVFTNQGAGLYPSNSNSGMYFSGTTGDFFKNSNSGIRMSNSTDSVWICFTENSGFTGTYDCILGTANVSGYGIMFWTAEGSLTLIPNSPSTSLNVTPVGIQWDVGWSPKVAGSSLINTWTNGILTTVTNTWINSANSFLWGVGQDANSDNNARMYLKFALICTNYIFTSSDLGKLHAYAITH